MQMEAREMVVVDSRPFKVPWMDLAQSLETRQEGVATIAIAPSDHQTTAARILGFHLG